MIAQLVAAVADDGSIWRFERFIAPFEKLSRLLFVQYATALHMLELHKSVHIIDGDRSAYLLAEGVEDLLGRPHFFLKHTQHILVFVHPVVR